MNLKPEVNPVFPEAVLMFKFPREITKEEVNFYLNCKLRKNESNYTSENPYILKEKIAKDICDFAHSCLSFYLKNIFCADSGINISVTQSWLNVTKKGETHHKHHHPNSFLSGVFYIAADEKTDRICFFRGRPITPMNIDVTPKNFNPFNSAEFILPIHTGHMLIFPSTLEHFVPRVDTDSTRISLSFNSMVTGTLGSSDLKTRLEIRGVG